jgi:hypothetical protein
MLKLIARLFAADTRSTSKRSTRTRLSVERMEERATPTLIANPVAFPVFYFANPGTLQGFNPQPDPPALV